MIVFILFILLVLILAFIIINNTFSQKLLFGGSSIVKLKNNTTKYYYSIYNGDIGLVYDELKHLLAQYNFHELPLTKPVHVSFGSLSSKDIYGNNNAKQHMINGRLQWWDPLFLHQKAVIKNTLGGHKLLSEKIKLYETIKKLIPVGIKYIPKTYTIAEFEMEVLLLSDIKQENTQLIQNNKNIIYILKKNNLDQQKGVRVFSEKKEYFKIKKELNIKPHNAIIMEYVTNPAITIDHKKFHLRMYVLVIYESGIKRCYIHDECKILTAELPYKKEDWLNRKIHISCGSTTIRTYKFPNDVLTKIDSVKFNEFKKTLAYMAAANNSIIYEENDIGYHIYGVDVLITDDTHFFILEFNGYGLGFNCSIDIKNTPACDIYRTRFSKDYFSFILNSTVFPAFGLKRRPTPYVEVCGHGVLSPFFNILTGSNLCELIPYIDASEIEIKSAKKIIFNTTLPELIKICYIGNIFLISKHSEKNNGQNNSIIGFLALDHNNYLTILIMEEYQNCDIAAAMVAQFLEIYAHRHIITKDHSGSNPKIHMVKKSIFIDNIAKKLNFILEKDSANSSYTRLCKI